MFNLKSIISVAAIATLMCSCAQNKTVTPDKLIALSFDDGPSDVTESILNTLQKEDIKATFFVVPSWAKNENVDNTRFMKQAHDMGCVIGNHTWDHPYLTSLSEEEILAEVNNTSDFIESIIGERPTLIRCPYLNENERMHEIIDLTFIAGVDCEDWVPEVTTEMRVQRLLDKVKDGDIILIHDFAGNVQTAEAIKTLIPSLKEQGYEFVTIPELFERKGVTPVANSGVTYNNALDK